jgi:hypothetical protein
MEFILYTYMTDSEAPGGFVCHAYGPTTLEAGQAEGERLVAEHHGTPSPLTFMVLVVEALSARFATAAVSTHAIFRSKLVFQGAPEAHIYLTSDPAAGDALCTAWEGTVEAFTAMVLALEAMPS